MLARWRPCSTTSGELYRRYCANKKENAGRVANYLRTMGTIWRPLSRPKVMMMGQIAYLDAYGVKRQWCSHRGKVDTCQVGVFMGYVCGQEHILLDFRLSLPEEWARDE